MVSAGQPRHADAGYYCDGGDDGVSQHQQHLRRHPRYRYLLSASRVGQFSLSPKLYDFRTDDVSDGAFRGRAFSPFVSSIGLLTQTGDSSRKSFICGSALCLLVAIITPLTRLFCAIPLAISSAVMLVSYLPLLYSGLVFSQQITFTARNIYRPALPLLSAFF